MKSYKIILASASPRRAQLLKLLDNVEFKALPSDADESYDPVLPPEQIVMRLAGKKAAHILGQNPCSIVLGADTLVVSGGVILGKPSNFEDAVKMFERLCNSAHKVYTGICIVSKQKTVKSYAVTTITFGAFDEKIVYDYIKSGKSYDKAGGYGIQDEELKPLIARVDGDITNVIGLPLMLTKELLEENF